MALLESPQPPADEKEQEAATAQPVETSSRKKVLIVVVSIVVVLLISAGVGAYLAFFYKPRVEPEVARKVPEAIGPRSILEGLDRLQQAHFDAAQRYATDLPKLIGEFATNPSLYSAAWHAAVSNELQKGTLVMRVVADGYEFALRQTEKRWLVYSRFGKEAPRIATQETDGGPPFVPEAEETAASKEAEAELQVELEEYRDPSGYFSVMLPKGFTPTRSGSPPNIRVTFQYTNALRMTIKAMETARGWDPTTELSAKSEQIRGGHVPAFNDFRLVVTNLVDVDGGTGYEMGLVGVGAKAGLHTHTFAFGGERIMLSIAVLCSEKEAKPLFEAVLQSIRGTLRLETKPLAAPVIRAEPLAKPASASTTTSNAAVSPEPVLTEEEKKQWTEARALLKTTGIMQSGDSRVALVNDQLVRVGDTVTVNLKNKPFRFRVKEITRDDVQFEPVYRSEASAADQKKL